MSATFEDLEEMVKVVNSTKPLIIRLPSKLFDEVKGSGHLSQVDLWVSMLIIEALKKEGWLK
jgi:hypothetical protein